MFPSLSHFFIFVYMILLLYIRYFSATVAKTRLFPHRTTLPSLSLPILLPSLPPPSRCLYPPLSLSAFLCLLLSNTQTLLLVTDKGVLYCSLHVIPALEISAITILVYKTLGQIEPIRCRRHGRRRSNNRKSDRAKKINK